MNIYFSRFQKSRGDYPPRKIRGGTRPPPPPRCDFFFSYDIFVHGSTFQFIDGINLNLTHVCVCCEIIFILTYIALVIFVYKVKEKKKIKINKNITKNATNGLPTHAV